MRLSSIRCWSTRHSQNDWLSALDRTKKASLASSHLLHTRWTFAKAPFTRYNRLSNPLSNRFDNRLYRVYSRLSNRLYNPVWQPFEQTVLFVQHDCQTGCQTRLTTGWMFVYTIQPVVKPVVQLLWQPVVSCKRGLSLWWSQLFCQKWELFFVKPGVKVDRQNYWDIPLSQQMLAAIKLVEGVKNAIFMFLHFDS